MSAPPGNLRPRVLVVGQLPPPVHGSNVMAVELLASLRRIGVAHEFVDKGLSRRIEEVGRSDSKKVLRAASLLVRSVATAARRGPFEACVYFLSCARAAFFVDAITVHALGFLRLPIVPYLHGIGFRDLAASDPISRATVRSVFRASSRVVVLGNRAAIDVEPWVSPDRTTIIRNTVPDPGRRLLEERCDRTEKAGCSFLYISTLDPSKGAEEFVQAAIEAAQQCPAARFKIAGPAYDSTFHQRLLDQIDKAGLSERIVLVGPAYDAAKTDLLAAADVFVFPTRYRFENQPLVILEAMAAGLAIVSTALGCIPDQVVNGLNGFLVPEGDAAVLASRLVEMSAKPEMREAMGRASRQRFESFFDRSAFDTAWEHFLGHGFHSLDTAPSEEASLKRPHER